jgi:site-specific DNA-methyltransferase (adenine-specific)
MGAAMTGMPNRKVQRALEPYYQADGITLYLGDCREVLPQLDLAPVDVVIADPPYGETSLAWDRWPTGWPALAAPISRSLWCFGSLRMFLDRRDEFAGWKLSQDIVWRKHNGSSRATDRFRRVHEQATHWYRGPWSEVHHAAPRVVSGVDPRSRSKPSNDAGSPHLGGYGTRTVWTDDGTRLVTSVLEARSTHRQALHPTQKPLGLLLPLIEYACPPGGLLLDPFVGSGSTLLAARIEGRHAIGIEIEERWAEVAAKRLAQGVLTW